MDRLILATRKSPLALAQAEEARARLAEALPGCTIEILKVTTTGDKRDQWSLEKEGGKGLFTKELEDALLEGRAHVAIHSAKDLPTQMPEGLTLAAFLPRAPAHDILVLQAGVAQPQFIATSSPRRRQQLKKLFPKAVWSEIRGNVDTRLRKVANGHQAEATMLAAAGLQRLGITAWPGLVFKPMDARQLVPAVGQGAIALQATPQMAECLRAVDDAPTRRAVTLERRFLAAMGGGCHIATAGHVCGDHLLAYHEDSGYAEITLPKEDPEAAVDALAEALLARRAQGEGA